MGCLDLDPKIKVAKADDNIVNIAAKNSRQRVYIVDYYPSESNRATGLKRLDQKSQAPANVHVCVSVYVLFC